MSTIDKLSYAHPAGFREIEVAAAAQHLGDFEIIDVREPNEYTAELGHVAGAKLVPLGTVVDAAAGWDRSKTYLLVCRSGGRSGRACAALAQMGFGKLYNLAGGMLAWNDRGLPIQR